MRSSNETINSTSWTTGKPVSDSGRNFFGARNHMMKVQETHAEQKNKKSVGKFMIQQRIDWETVPPRSPQFGGL